MTSKVIGVNQDINQAINNNQDVNQDIIYQAIKASC
jgi:hypothetical protein